LALFLKLLEIIHMYDVYASGDMVKTGTQTDNRVISVEQNRSVTGSKDYVTDSDVRKNYRYIETSSSCGAWSPSPMDVPWGQTYTASRTCTVTETRYYDRYYRWAKQGDKLVTSKISTGQTRNDSTTESTTLTGRLEPCRTDPMWSCN